MDKKNIICLVGILACLVMAVSLVSSNNYFVFQENEKVYKSIIGSNINMHPSDCKKSLDDFSFFNYLEVF